MIIEKNALRHIHFVVDNARASERSPTGPFRWERGPRFPVRVLLMVNAFSQGSPGVAPCETGVGMWVVWSHSHLLWDYTLSALGNSLLGNGGENSGVGAGGGRGGV